MHLLEVGQRRLILRQSTLCHLNALLCIHIRLVVVFLDLTAGNMREICRLLGAELRNQQMEVLLLLWSTILLKLALAVSRTIVVTV